MKRIIEVAGLSLINQSSEADKDITLTSEHAEIHMSATEARVIGTLLRQLAEEV